MSLALPLAANDNDPSHFDYFDHKWTSLEYDHDDEDPEEVGDDRTITEIEWVCSTRPTHVRFSPADAVRLGFECNVFSIEYLDYLMGDLVADEDWDASQALKRRYGEI
jgi:hypothetical protein